MFQSLTLHGGAATILWGYRPAATLRSWRIAKVQGRWTLRATLERPDAFMLRQRPLLFTAPREGAHDGFWAWGVEAIEVGATQLTATLGPPEQ